MIVDVESGAGHSLAIDSYGIVYSWGASADFQTGIWVEPKNQIGDTKQFVMKPERLDVLCKNNQFISKAACGIKHTILLTTNNDLICFGSNEFG